jgi:hypothetical protein
VSIQVLSNRLVKTVLDVKRLFLTKGGIALISQLLQDLGSTLYCHCLILFVNPEMAVTRHN